MWSDLPKTSVDVSGEIDRLDELFAIGTKPVAAVPETKPTGRKPNPTTLLDLTRAQNVSIVLTRIKVPFPELRVALLQCDESKLTVDHLKSIKSCLPTPEELSLVRDYDGDMGGLSKADQFFHEMLGIPRLSERLACMVYMRKFELDLEELKPDLRILKHAVDEVNGSVKFKTVLHTVLMIGNVLNSATFRGEAAGFQLGDLLKLKDTKPAQVSAGVPSLLHYLVKVLNRTDKSLVGFLDDCSHVEAAARLSTSSVMQSVTALVSGYAAVKEEMSILQRIGISSQSDAFLTVTADFVRTANPQVKALQLASSTVQSELGKVLTYFGEDPSQTKPEEFFGLVSSFGQQLMRAEEEMLQVERKREEEEKRKNKVVGRFGIPVFGPEVRGPLAGKGSVRGEEREEGGDEVTPTVSRFNADADTDGGEAKIKADKPELGRRSYRGRGQLDEAIKELRAGAARKVRDTTSPTKPGSRFLSRPIDVDPSPESVSIGGTIGRTRFSPDTLQRQAAYATLSANPNATLSGRKSLRMKNTANRRPLSRVFLTGDRVDRDE